MSKVLSALCAAFAVAALLPAAAQAHGPAYHVIEYRYTDETETVCEAVAHSHREGYGRIVVKRVSDAFTHWRDRGCGSEHEPAPTQPECADYDRLCLLNTGRIGLTTR